MARRPPSGASPFGAAPPPRRAIHDPNESAFSRFLREEIFSPENIEGNLKIVTSVAVFFGGDCGDEVVGRAHDPGMRQGCGATRARGEEWTLKSLRVRSDPIPVWDIQHRNFARAVQWLATNPSRLRSRWLL